jgi:oligopeptide transport system substrate-binding protein
MKVAAAVFSSALMLVGATACSSNPTDGASGGNGSGAVTAITVRGCTPQHSLLPVNTNEVCGGNVLDASQAKLIHYNSKDAAPQMDIAESIETTDAINWTVKLKQGYKFQDGTEVKAKHFVDAWNWGAYGPHGQVNSYFFEMIEGYADEQCGESGDCQKEKPKADTMSGLKVVDDYTFTIKTTSPTSNLVVRLGYTAFAPQPDAFFADTTEDKSEFAAKPISAGPYRITSVTDTEIVLEKFADYSGKDVGAVDKVTFPIYNDLGAAYNDVVANNLDMTDTIPAGNLVDDLWKSDAPDRWGTKDTGVFQALSYAPGNVDPGLADVKMRQALSMAVNRDEVTKQVFNGARVPATGWVPPMVDGYKANACGDNCVFDAAKAKQLYDEAGGYPGTLSIWVNGDGGHDPWASAVCNQIKNNLGLDCSVQTTPDFATLRDMIMNRELKGLYRAGWQMDYPSIENFLTPLYATGASSNDTDYSSAEFDGLLKEAAAATDNTAANKLYQQAELVLGQDMPTMPLWYQQSQYIFSDKIASVDMTPFSRFDFGSVKLK